MKTFIREFILRGFLAAGSGPVVLAIIYGILGATGVTESLSPQEVCTGILSVTMLAFFVGGMSAIYQMEQLPILIAILIHGGGLYIAYAVFYLINSWMNASLLVFTAIFAVSYGLIWLFIYTITNIKTAQLNKKLQNQQ